MSIKAYGVGLAVAAVSAFTMASAAVAGPAVTTQWTDTNLSQDECLERAERALQDTRYGRIEKVGQSRFATRGDYTASIRCVTSKNIVFFLIAGPSRDRTSGDMDKLYNNF
jgi:hypothetical protein